MGYQHTIVPNFPKNVRSHEAFVPYGRGRGGCRLVVGKKEVPTIANPMQILLHIFYMFQSQEFVSLRQIHREKTH